MRTSFHHQPEAQHPKSSAIHKLPADYPIFPSKADISRHARPAAVVANDTFELRPDPQPVSCRMLNKAHTMPFLSLGGGNETA
jgi:hypothetical protein